MLAIGEPKQIEDRYPLSPSQQGMLFHTLADPGSGVYIAQVRCDLHEVVDAPALRAAWIEAVARHPALRTSFVWTGNEEPWQEVHAQVEVPWRELNWIGLSPAQQDQRLEAFLDEEQALGFDTTQPPLMRLALLHYAKDRSCLVWTMHHAIADGWGLAPVLLEAFSRYDAQKRGEPLALEPPPRFRDYIDSLQSQDMAAAEAFWRPRLAGFARATPFRVEAPPAANDLKSHRRDLSEEIHLPRALADALVALGAESGFNLNTILQGLWSLLLSRYSGETDVVFGVTRTGRRASLPGSDAMVGLLLNVLPLRVSVTPDAPLISWLQTLRRQWASMRDFDHTPLLKVQGWSDIPRGQPLFETVMTYEGQSLGARMREMAPAWTGRSFVAVGQSNYPVTLMAFLEDELRLELEFDRARLDRATAARLLTQLRVWLEAVVETPHVTLRELSAIGSPAAAQAARPAKALIDPAGSPDVRSLIEAQVAARPDAVAVASDTESITYAEMDARATRMAAGLRAAGVSPGKIVGLFADRSLDAICAIVGILKAGCAYLPIDPEYPTQRIEFVLRQSGAAVVLTQSHLTRLLPGGVSALDLEALSATDWPAAGAAPPVDPDALAYVIYTSGSTGQPKGVMVSHANLAFSTASRIAYYRQPVDGYVLLSSLSFDSSVAGLFWALGTGGRLILPPPGAQRDPTAIAALVEQRAASHILALPSLYRMILEARPQALKSLKVAIVAGESCPVSLVKQHRQTLPGAVLFNEYGPTEGTVWCTVFEATKDISGPRTPIGGPIPGSRIYVVQDGALVGDGQVGELYVGGPGVAQGYLGRPDLTAHSFLPNPFGDGGRVYRTGDLARALPDGAFDLIGRTDHQVKIRGHRVELGEIEDAILETPGVWQAAVALRSDQGEADQLVGYVALSDGARVSGASIRDQLKRKLPAYMAPSSFIVVDELPLGPNGKLDRAALVTVRGEKLPAGRIHMAPQTPAQRGLAAIWTELLKLTAVGVHDDFFEMGGDSLLAIRLLNQVNSGFGKQLRVADIYDNATIAKLAGLLERDDDGPRRPRSFIVPLKPGAGALPLYLFHGGPTEVRLAEFFDLRPIYALEQPWLETWLSAAEESRWADIPTAEQLVEPLVDQLCEHTAGKPFALGGHSTKGVLAFELARQVRERGGAPALVLLFDAWRGYPGRLDIARYRLRKTLEDRGRDGSSVGLRAVLQAGARVPVEAMREVARLARNALWPRLKLQVAKAGEHELTSIFNEEGVMQLWGRVEPVFTKVQRTYRPRPLPMRAVQFVAAREMDLEARAIDPAMGWGGLFENGLDVVSVPSNHHFSRGPDDPLLSRALNVGLAAWRETGLSPPGETPPGYA